MKPNTFLVFAAAFAAALHSANAQLIINGGFETPDTPTFVQINAGQRTIAPWVVGLHSVEVGDAAGNGFIVGPAFEGAQFLDLNGLQRGRLTQAFATTPGSLYKLTFAYTDNYWEPSPPASARVRVFDGLGDRLNQTITHTGAVVGNYHWTVFNEQFTAVTNTASLEFTSLTSSPSGHSGGILLDAVQVSLAAPAMSVLKIASPSSYKDREGAGCFCGDSSDPYRYQLVFPAADFAALGNKPHWIVGFGPRADQSVTSPHTAYLPDNEIRLSTTQWGPGNRSSVFDLNFGSDVIQFYRGPLTMVADVAGQGPGPREFYHPDFPAGVTPFLYDPSQGNLLFDFIAWQGESPKILADQIPGLQTPVVGDPFATQGYPGLSAIFQFTFVPVPELSDPHWSGSQFQFTLTGATNVNYVIQASTDLQSWTQLATNHSPNVSRNINVDAPSSRSFYRAVVGPY